VCEAAAKSYSNEVSISRCQLFLKVLIEECNANVNVHVTAKIAKKDDDSAKQRNIPELRNEEDEERTMKRDSKSGEKPSLSRPDDFSATGMSYVSSWKYLVGIKLHILSFSNFIKYTVYYTLCNFSQRCLNVFPLADRRYESSQCCIPFFASIFFSTSHIPCVPSTATQRASAIFLESF